MPDPTVSPQQLTPAEIEIIRNVTIPYWEQQLADPDIDAQQRMEIEADLARFRAAVGQPQQAQPSAAPTPTAGARPQATATPAPTAQPFNLSQMAPSGAYPQQGAGDWTQGWYGKREARGEMPSAAEYMQATGGTMGGGWMGQGAQAGGPLNFGRDEYAQELWGVANDPNTYPNERVKALQALYELMNPEGAGTGMTEYQRATLGQDQQRMATDWAQWVQQQRQQQAQWLAKQGPRGFPAGTQYAPGFEPEGMMAEVMKRAGLPYNAEGFRTMPYAGGNIPAIQVPGWAQNLIKTGGQ